ncbi:hypothetical protein LTR37_012201 [Vermiconidia calcicola]|uniref:Uncharacterized protein n=1 Tax=Vermiconidia calcicola TaxID=1690605 RepID=A0ACC3N013_9PEZI|nr:hypothetical protein LTR37_012201 [Vermiconidia calcicola]
MATNTTNTILKHETAATSTAAKVCRLTILPAELRNVIYRHVLLSEHSIDIAAARSKSSLLETCKQIRQEASSMFYSENTFVWQATDGNCNGLISWLAAIGPESAASIPQLKIDFQLSDVFRAAAPTTEISNVTREDVKERFAFEVAAKDELRRCVSVLLPLPRLGLSYNRVLMAEDESELMKGDTWGWEMHTKFNDALWKVCIGARREIGPIMKAELRGESTRDLFRRR